MTILYITPKAWKQIESAVRKDPSVETGGVMMGYPMDNNRWVVTYASEPGPKAIQHPKSVYFDDGHLGKLVRKLSKTRQWQYLGDWHSHTIKRLSPSKGDKKTILEKATQSIYTSPSPLMLIVGLGKQNQVQARGFILGNSLREVGKIELFDRQVHQPRGETSL
ncbi:Mov34/MPN/PAD-1 family protein [Brevibacillus choshinensis]|uniref:Mov34/MPN/PAD-1 family protein n=1 Tax=Brevibacillus choshinensis TaxID=54911 RepID=UPI0009F8C013|nr:Mov34/MPN/PAD-1 family protein [Brevibacillus choshinensis]MED4585592.1 Mov34/MPN/PAD-1 family protein [Brevibacillus choshinensis]MED4754089.1 Mov34/MPN/PAD-1 family protein [Brevibacillus choshinensis]MED4779220.1 Mov34/MPN/PAD-1 family protein [Brevibacillus choshinensis]